MKINRTVKSVLVVFYACFSFGVVAQANSSVFKAVFESALSKFIFTETVEGRELLNQVLGTSAKDAASACYSCFVQTLVREDYRSLAEEIQTTLKEVGSDLRAFRDKSGIASSKALSVEEIEYLTKNLQVGKFIQTETIAKLLDSSAPNLIVRKRPFQDLEGFEADQTLSTVVSEIVRSLENDTLGWSQRILLKVRAYRYFVSALMRENFSAKDVQLVRKINGLLLAALNGFTKMRLQVSAFVQERPSLYATLNENTAADTEAFMKDHYIDGYIKARSTAAEKLGLSGVIASTEKAMLESIEGCRKLGGSGADKSEILILEDNIKANETLISNLDRKIAEASRLKQDALRFKVDRDIARKELDDYVSKLKDNYLEFIQDYDGLEVFINLRNGRMMDQEVRVFTLPDPFMATQDQLDAWHAIYERAVKSSTRELVIDELKAFGQAQIGMTRSFIQNLNKEVEAVYGKGFVDSLSHEFQGFDESVIRVALKRILIAGLGTTAGTLATTKISDTLNQLFKQVISGNTPAAQN